MKMILNAKISVMADEKFTSLLFMAAFLQLVVQSNCAKPVLWYSIFENQPPSTVVANLTKDFLANVSSSIPPNIQFDIVNQDSTGANWFNSSSSGILITTVGIDRESICPQEVMCTIALKVAAHALPDFILLLDVYVDVADIADYAPLFATSTMTLSINEGNAAGLTLRLPTATDLDSPQLGIATYQLYQDDRMSDDISFALKVTRDAKGNAIPFLVVNFVLDREVMETYSLTVICFNKASPPLNGTLLIKIAVLDINDNVPRFTNSTYVASIPENINNVDILQVKAFDADIGLNGLITYSFDTVTQQRYGTLFAVNSTSGIVRLNSPLRYEVQATYILKIIAQDSGPESTPNDVEVIISVISSISGGLATIAVKSLTSSGQLIISERVIPGTFVALISVKARDAHERWQCFVGSKKLSLIPIDGTNMKIVTNGCVNFDPRAPYINATVTCSEPSNPTQLSSQNFSIIVAKNDARSALSFQLTTMRINVQENNQPELELVKLNASDSYCDQSITYHIVTSSCYEFISIDPNSGSVTAKVSFDYEQLKMLTCVITATDLTRSPSMANVTIDIAVIDINDVAPKFSTHLYTFHVLEEQNASMVIGQLIVTDNELTPNNEFFITIDSASPIISQFFYVNPTSGFITLLRPLDREKQSHMINMFLFNSLICSVL